MASENIIIIGSGPAAFTAAIYCARADLNPLIVEGKEPGGQLMGTTFVENWPGEKKILGPDLIKKLREHAQNFNTRFLSEEIVKADLTQHPFQLTTHKNKNLSAKAIIIATGATPKRLGCPGEDTYWGKGVTTCAVCDGAFYKDKKVIVVGGGDTAMENASFMTNFTKDITVVHILDKLTASPIMQDRVLNNPAITIRYESSVTQIIGDESRVTSAVIKNQKTGHEESIAADAIFIAVGLNPNTQIFKGQLELTRSGHIFHPKNTETSIPGVFAAGDVADPRYRQAITSAASGCMAALDVERWLKEQ